MKRRIPHIFKRFHLRRNHRCYVLRYADKSVDKPSPTRHTTKIRFCQLNYGQHTGGTRSYSRTCTRTPNGRTTDRLRARPWAAHGLLFTGCIRTHYGQVTVLPRAWNGLVTDLRRPSSFRGTPVERARVCSSVVRSAFVRRSVASCVAFVLCWFVWRSCAAAHRVNHGERLILIVDDGASTSGHGNGRTDGSTTDGQGVDRIRAHHGRTYNGLATDT